MVRCVLVVFKSQGAEEHQPSPLYAICVFFVEIW